VNRKMRRAAKRLVAEAAPHWDDIRRIKREYDALPEAEKAENKKLFAAAIDERLAALIAE
jgi:hypothetical protein